MKPPLLIDTSFVSFIDSFIYYERIDSTRSRFGVDDEMGRDLIYKLNAAAEQTKKILKQAEPWLFRNKPLLFLG
ncbi:MAG: hypothetical protein MPW13_17570 [Candidatus Manganitrophus sp.]|nr:hypothetical protein [Candidatus Manganitrophus sp.]